MEEGIPLLPTVLRASKKVKKALESSLLAGAFLTRWLYDLANVGSMRKKRKESSSEVVQKEVVNIRLKKKGKSGIKLFRSSKRARRELRKAITVITKGVSIKSSVDSTGETAAKLRQWLPVEGIRSKGKFLCRSLPFR